jgi:hypothetical protein
MVAFHRLRSLSKITPLKPDLLLFLIIGVWLALIAYLLDTLTTIPQTSFPGCTMSCLIQQFSNNRGD